MEQKFYTDKDYDTLIKDLLNLNQVEIGNFLEFHYGQVYTPSRLNWLMSIRAKLLQLGKEPTNISDIGYTSVDGSNIKLDMAFHWIRNTLTKQVKELNQRSNKEFYPELLTTSDIPDLLEKLEKTKQSLEKDKTKPISQLHSDFLNGHKELLEQRIIELTTGSNDTPDEDKPFVMDFVKVFALDSGNSTTDSDFYALAVECTKSHYPMQRYRVIPRIRKFIERNSDYKELIVARFIFGLKLYIEERQKKFNDPKNNIETNVLLKGQYQALEGAMHILDWFQEGMGNYVEKNLVENSDSIEKFETLKEALRFLQRYDLIETPKTTILQNIQEALFNQQFNAYLLDELKVETEIKRMHEGKEMHGIKDWTSYLNEKTLLDFLKYQKDIAEQGHKKHLDKKEALHAHVNGSKKTSTPKNKIKTESPLFSLRQIAIAYAAMNIIITPDNATDILKKHSNYTSSQKLIQKRINKLSDLTKLSENKTSDTKHLKDLKEAKRLVSGIKNTKAETELSRIITAFETSYNSHY